MPFGNAVGEGFVNGSILIVNKVIVEGANEGVFVYNGTPAAGNLEATFTGNSGVDSFGNNYLQGCSTYSSGFATNMNNGLISVYTGTLASGWLSQGSMQAVAGGGFIITAPSGVTFSAPSMGGTIAIPQSAISGFPLPNDSNSGTGWVSGERAFMNSNWIAPINSLYAALVGAGIIS